MSNQHFNNSAAAHVRRRWFPAAALLALAGASNSQAATPPAVPISQVPLTINIPAHPQIVFAVANSQSMDGDLSGAIMAGSGGLAANLSTLQSSSSPLNFNIPAGFTPPLNPGAAGVAPYTVPSGGSQFDNSPSRLNVAKAGIAAILDSYLASADFALMDYQTARPNRFNTWLYLMSAPGGFTFTSIPGIKRYVPNPCFGVDTSAGDPVANNCANLDDYYGSQDILTKRYVEIGASSDDPSINDVLYAGGLSPVCVVYGGPNPATPFPPNFSLGDYNVGGVGEGYTNQVNPCAPFTGPTNAGFVPYSTEVMYVQRGFGFYSFGQSATNGTVLVTMQSAGATPTAASVAAARANFTAFLAPESNSNGSGEIKATALQSSMAGLISGAQRYISTSPPSSNGCPTQRYVILLTDGLPTMDLNGRAWPPLGSASALGYSVTATFNGDGTLAATNSQALTDVITNLNTLRAAGTKTYIIGLGAGVDPTKNPIAAQTLKAMAIAGGTDDYFPATSPDTLTNDLQVILSGILAATQSVASAAVNSTGLNTDSVVYQSQFLTSDAAQDWTGNMFAFHINPDTGVVDNNVATAVWSAQSQLDAQSATSRLIATWDPIVSGATAFRWTAGPSVSGISSSTSLGTQLSTFAPDSNGQHVLDYLRGDSALEKAQGGQFRNRSHKLGDIVNSNPLYVGASSNGDRSASYVAFAASNASRPPVIYVGADDGMLHAFDATTGNERFAYIPRGVYGNLINLVSPFYNAVHRFYVNGSPQASDIQFGDASWHTVLVSSEGAGGKSVFAIDVSNPATIINEAALASTVLWDFTDADMGLGFATPAIAKTSSGWRVFVGNGYNSANRKPFLFALDAQTGATVAKIDLCAAVGGACNNALSNGLSSAIAVNGGGQIAGSANLIYAGDLQGNLWRVDISDPNPASWTVSLLFQARDASNNPQPITTAPVATLNPRFPNLLGTMVYFGTGQFLGTPDLGTTTTQSIYGIYDPPGGYGGSPPTRTNLTRQVLSTASVGAQAVRLVTSNAVNLPVKKGWYIDLTLLAGERAITDPRIESGGALVLTTFRPSPNPCSAGGESYLLVLNFATGGAFNSAQFDVNGDHNIDAGDTVAGANPVGLSLGGVYASAPTIRSANFSTGSAVKLITESSGVIKSVVEKGSSKHRTAWWETRQ